jgi:hypothetical protein
MGENSLNLVTLIGRQILFLLSIKFCQLSKSRSLIIGGSSLIKVAAIYLVHEKPGLALPNLQGDKVLVGGGPGVVKQDRVLRLSLNLKKN